MSLLGRPDDIVTTGITTAVVMVVAGRKSGPSLETAHLARCQYHGRFRGWRSGRVDWSAASPAAGLADNSMQETL
jgi:hypothetical protein